MGVAEIKDNEILIDLSRVSFHDCEDCHTNENNETGEY